MTSSKPTKVGSFHSQKKRKKMATKVKAKRLYQNFKKPYMIKRLNKFDDVTCEYGDISLCRAMRISKIPIGGSMTLCMRWYLKEKDLPHKIKLVNNHYITRVGYKYE